MPDGSYVFDDTGTESVGGRRNHLDILIPRYGVLLAMPRFHELTLAHVFLTKGVNYIIAMYV